MNSIDDPAFCVNEDSISLAIDEVKVFTSVHGWTFNDACEIVGIDPSIVLNAGKRRGTSPHVPTPAMIKEGCQNARESRQVSNRQREDGSYRDPRRYVVSTDGVGVLVSAV